RLELVGGDDAAPHEELTEESLLGPHRGYLSIFSRLRTGGATLSVGGAGGGAAGTAPGGAGPPGGAGAAGVPRGPFAGVGSSSGCPGSCVFISRGRVSSSSRRCSSTSMADCRMSSSRPLVRE